MVEDRKVEAVRGAKTVKAAAELGVRDGIKQLCGTR
jgi:chorismate mutase